MKKDAKRLLMPCVIVRIIVCANQIFIKKDGIILSIEQLVESLLWGNHYNLFWGREMVSVGRVWFLIALFWAKTVYRLLINTFDKEKRLVIFSFLSVISLLFGLNHIVLPQNFDMLFLNLLYLEIGKWIKEEKILERTKSWTILIFCILWPYLVWELGYWIGMNGRYYPGYGICVFVSIIACVSVLRFCYALENTRISVVLQIFGKNTICLLMIQSITPYFFQTYTAKEKILDITIECLIVVMYAGLKFLWHKLVRKPSMV